MHLLEFFKITEAVNPDVKVKDVGGGTFKAYLKRRYVGYVSVYNFKDRDGKLAPDERYIWKAVVKPGFKRTGIGTALYNAAEKWLNEQGLKLVPSPDQQLSDEAYAFWQKRNPDLLKNHARTLAVPFQKYVGQQITVDDRPAVITKALSNRAFKYQFTDVPEGSPSSQGARRWEMIRDQLTEGSAAFKLSGERGEAWIHTDPNPNLLYNIWKNSSEQDLRGTTFSDGKTFWWDSNLATHAVVMGQLGYKDPAIATWYLYQDTEDKKLVLVNAKNRGPSGGEETFRIVNRLPFNHHLRAVLRDPRFGILGYNPRQAGLTEQYTSPGWDDEEDTQYDNLPSMQQAAAHKPEIVKRVQQRYNEWEVDEEGYDEEVGGGGICHLLADIIADVLNDAGFPTWTVSSTHEQHVYCVSQASDGVWEVDIPYCIYEVGGGYSWTKIPDVAFQPDDIVINRLSVDPSDINQYADVEEW